MGGEEVVTAVDRMLTYHAQNPGFDSQHCTNGVCSHMSYSNT